MLLLIDGNNLAFRVHYTHQHLTSDGAPTGVIYGGLQSIHRLRKMFPKATKIICCWDSRSSLRKEIDPTYKADRKHTSDRQQIFDQIPMLKEALSMLGISNVEHDGFEADDIIAVLCKNRKVTIVSTDTDLYQLLTEDVVIFKPTMETLYGLTEFIKEFDVQPNSWATILAIAGGKNNVKGVPGVGVKTVIKFMSYEKIQEKLSNAIAVFVASGKAADNLKLTKLPLKDFNPKIQRAKPDEATFRELCTRYKFSSILREFGNWRTLISCNLIKNIV